MLECKKEDIVLCWNESEEIVTSFCSLTDEEVIECKESLINRALFIRNCLGKYITEKDLKEFNII